MTGGVTVLGFTLPNDLMRDILAEDPGMPTQTHAFAWALVDALRSAGMPVTLLSSAPVSTYPANRRIRFHDGQFTANGVDGELMGFVNILAVKHMSRFLGTWRVGAAAMREWDTRVLLIHGVHSPFLWFGVLARRLRGLIVVPVLTDPPGVVLPTDGPLTRWLKRIDISVTRRALRRCNGAVVLTQALAEDFAPGLPVLVMEGIANPVGPITPYRPDPAGPFLVVYAGGLSRAYGVDRLVRAVRGLADDGVRLSVFGRGELEDWLIEQSAVDGRIAAPRFLPREELVPELARASLLVNPRPVSDAFVRYSFPSKLIEYMSTGVPVLTTRLPGIPRAYEGHVLFADDDTPTGLRSAIARARAAPPPDLRAVGAEGADLIRQTRNAATQGARIRDFLASLAGPSA